MRDRTRLTAICKVKFTLHTRNIGNCLLLNVCHPVDTVFQLNGRPKAEYRLSLIVLLLTIFQSKVRKCWSWEKIDIYLFPTNLSPVCYNFTKIGILRTILERCRPTQWVLLQSTDIIYCDKMSKTGVDKLSAWRRRRLLWEKGRK